MNDSMAQATAKTLQVAEPGHVGDASQCGEWLARLASGEPDDILEAIRSQLESLLAADIAPATRLEILEVLWEPVAKRLATAASGYCNRAIPLATSEYDRWHRTIAIRLAMAAGFERCLADQQWLARCGKQSAALVCRRALEQLHLARLDHARAYQAVPGELWKRLHNIYQCAETHDLLQVETTAPDLPAPPMGSPRAAYLRALLFDQAQPYSMMPAQIEHVARWLGDWAGLASLRAEAPDGHGLTALAVDLNGTDGLKLLRHIHPGSGLRHLDTKSLGDNIKQLARALREGNEAVSVGLTADLGRPALEKLLTFLYVQWCSAGTGRAGERSFSTSKAMVTLTVPAMHFYISGRAFRQPGQGSTREEDEDLHVFGHITQRTTQKLVSQRSSAFEPWSIANESAHGMFALCREPDFRTRIAPGQLLGLMKRSDKPIELVMVQRLMLNEHGALEIGVRRVEGAPLPVAVRIVTAAQSGSASAANTSGKFERALLLPAIPEKSLPQRLLLQCGWYRARSTLELYAHQKITIRLLDLVEAGPNFELVVFEGA